jgi:ABC-2 type transport system permease protein
MTGFLPLLRKEITEQLRTYKLLIVGGVFILFGISTPFMLKYMPEILRLAGDQFIIEIPPPTAIQSLAEYASTIGQVGLLIAVLMGMGAISNEMRSGTAVMTLSKPVSRGAFVGAKLAALCLNFAVSVIIASAACLLYTIWLIEGSALVPYIGLNLLLVLFLVFCLALTLLCSSFFRSSLAAGGTAIALLISQAGLSAVPLIGDYMPGKLLGWGINLLAGRADSYWGALAVTVVIIALCIFLAQKVLRNKDL